MPPLTASVPLLDHSESGVTLRIAPLPVMLPLLRSVPGLRMAVVAAPTLSVPALAQQSASTLSLPCTVAMAPLFTRLPGLSVRLPPVVLSVPLFVKLPGLIVSVCA